jgi:hypothetical protein
LVGAGRVGGAIAEIYAMDIRCLESREENICSWRMRVKSYAGEAILSCAAANEDVCVRMLMEEMR